MGKFYLHGLLILVSGTLLLPGCSKSPLSSNTSTANGPLQYASGTYVLETGNSRVLPQVLPGNATVTEIDVTGPDGQRALDQHLVVDPSDGTIDLQASMNAGLFGPNPRNGDSRTLTIFYRVMESGQSRVLSTTLVARYFDSLSSVPPDITEDKTGAKPAATKSATAPAAPVAKPPQIIVVNKGH